MKRYLPAVTVAIGGAMVGIGLADEHNRLGWVIDFYLIYFGGVLFICSVLEVIWRRK